LNTSLFGFIAPQCGACTVHVDGAATRSCVTPVGSLTADRRIVTIGGLSPDASHPVQKAWIELDVPQCGYCQTGQIMAAAALLQANPKPSDDEIVAEMTNICRCGTYNRIKAAIKRAAETNRG
jgi:isoquinoline 1-oxidoreductase alpha subunit